MFQIYIGSGLGVESKPKHKRHKKQNICSQNQEKLDITKFQQCMPGRVRDVQGWEVKQVTDRLLRTATVKAEPAERKKKSQLHHYLC